ncbi:methylmalonyl Co-A mutase-associated GTPase MeaB [Desulfothermus okinawensis JCM 13304]
MDQQKLEEILNRIRKGDVRVVSRLIRNLEDRIPEAKEVIKYIYPYTGKARVIGITGAPGAGKSTITDFLISSYRKQEKSVGVLAVDPTSPFTGGALLGDRVRMQNHAGDKGVFIRSLATRGALGGLSAAVEDAIHVLDVMGKDIIIVETVGTGQSEVDIMNNAHTILVVLTPGMGDDVQTIKAGIMEIADIFVINKGDQPNARKLYMDLMRALDMMQEFPGGWRPPIVKLETTADPIKYAEQVDVLREKIDEHLKFLEDKDILKEREIRKAKVQLLNALESQILLPIIETLQKNGKMDDMVDKIAKKKISAYEFAEEIKNVFLRE